LSEKTTLKKVTRALNGILALVDLEPIDLVDSARFWAIRSATIFDERPVIFERLENLRGMLREVKHELSKFPIDVRDPSPVDADDLEGQIEHLINLIRMVKGFFDEIQADRDAMKSVISTQHSAIMQINESPTRGLDTV
jgi:hypothetical protein